MKKPDSLIRIPCKSVNGFFKHWFRFLRPLHKLTDREIDVISSFAAQRYELSKVIQDTEILDRYTMNSDTKKKVREECGISLQNFQVIMSNLRKHEVIIDNKINPKYIPNLDGEASTFQLMLHFEIG